MSEAPPGITSSGSFQHINGVGSGGGLRLSIPTIDPNRVQQERMGMSTPTEQIVGLSYGMGTPRMSTPSFRRK